MVECIKIDTAGRLGCKPNQSTGRLKGYQTACLFEHALGNFNIINNLLIFCHNVKRSISVLQSTFRRPE